MVCMLILMLAPTLCLGQVPVEVAHGGSDEIGRQIAARLRLALKQDQSFLPTTSGDRLGLAIHTSDVYKDLDEKWHGNVSIVNLTVVFDLSGFPFPYLIDQRQWRVGRDRVDEQVYGIMDVAEQAVQKARDRMKGFDLDD